MKKLHLDLKTPGRLDIMILDHIMNAIYFSKVIMLILHNNQPQMWQSLGDWTK